MFMDVHTCACLSKEMAHKFFHDLEEALAPKRLEL